MSINPFKLLKTCLKTINGHIILLQEVPLPQLRSTIKIACSRKKTLRYLFLKSTTL